MASLAGRAMAFIRRQKKPFKVNIVRNILQNFSLGLTYQYQSVYISELGASAMELGYVNSVGGLASTLITLPVGWLADRYGIKRILLTALPLMAVGYAVFGIAQGWEITMAALVLTSMSAAMAMTVCPMICGNTLESSERATGMQLCDTLAALPRIVAPVVAAFIISRFGGLSVEGIRPLYWLQTMGVAAAAAVIYFWFQNPIAPGAGGRRSLTEGVARILEEGTTVKRWILYQVISAFPMYMAIYVPLYAREFKLADQYTLGMMDTGYYLVVTLIAIPSGLIADRIGRRRLIAMVTPLYCASMLLLVYAGGSPVLILSGLLSGFNFVSGVTAGAMSVELMPRELLGSWFGLNGLFRGLVNMSSPILGGIIWNRLGPEYVFYFLAASQMLKLFILWTVPETTRRAPP
jgi:MFS family permease